MGIAPGKHVRLSCVIAFAVNSVLQSMAVNAQSMVHVNVNAISGKTQTAVIGETFPQVFVARVTYDDGSTVVGADIIFEANVCFVFSSGTNACPPAGLYGNFAGAGYDSELTDANGVASSSIFTAGTIVGQYQAFAGVNPLIHVNGNEIIDYPSTNNEFFSLTQVAAFGSVEPLPALSSWALTTLLFLVGGAGAIHTFRRSV